MNRVWRPALIGYLRKIHTPYKPNGPLSNVLTNSQYKPNGPLSNVLTNSPYKPYCCSSSDGMFLRPFHMPSRTSSPEFVRRVKMEQL